LNHDRFSRTSLTDDHDVLSIDKTVLNEELDTDTVYVRHDNFGVGATCRYDVIWNGLRPVDPGTVLFEIG
jgi:hypothetical protein